MSGLVTSPEFTGIQSPGGPGLYSPGPVQDLGHGHHQGGVTWAARAEVALNAPTLWQRCEELKVTLENCPVKVKQIIIMMILIMISCSGAEWDLAKHCGPDFHAGRRPGLGPGLCAQNSGNTGL